MKIQYSARMALGQVLAEGIGAVIEGEYKINRFYRSFRRMSAEDALEALKVSDYEGMKECLKKLLEVMQDGDLQDKLYALDQG
ncbi:MAG: hypothetical protein JAY71_18740 [Candidatus Thiodiazotropha weberae]|nr:hypothetical protein [Candidatus Thiodiazotropha weberae]